MRKLLTCTTALSVALSTAPTFPVHAQTVAEDGSVIGPDGNVICVPTADAPCDLELIMRMLRDAEAVAAAEAEAARVAAEEEAARAAAAAEEEAARAAAEAEAARVAAEEEAARAAAAAEEEAARVAAEQEAARVAAEEEAARAAAEAEAARVAAEEEAARAAAAAEEEAARAAAEAEAARVAAEEEAAAAAPEAEPVQEPAEEPAAETAPAEEPAPAAEPEAAPAEEPAPETAPEAAAPTEEAVPEAAPEAAAPTGEAAPEAAEAPETVTAPTGEAAPEATTEGSEAAAPTEEAAPEATGETAETTAEPAVEPAEETAPAGDTAATEDPAATEPAPEATPELVTEPAPETEPVDVPVVSEEAAVSLESILAAPTVTEEAAAEEAPATEGESAVAEGEPAAEPAPPVVPEAATAVLSTSGAAAGTETPPPAAEPVAVVSEVISEAMTRTSDQEFAAAPVAVSGGKKSGLSDLEKVGLLALGALVVGAVINQGNKDAKTVVSNSGDRVVVQNPDGSYSIYKDDDAVLRRPGVQTTTETYRDGSTRTVVQRANGTQVVTIRDASGRVLRRATYDSFGNEVILIDDLYPEERIDITRLPKPRPGRVTISTSDNDAALKAEMAALEAEDLGRKFSLRQIREIREVRSLAATIEVDSITFDTGSAAIKATEARKLADIGRLMQELLAANPREVFLIEGHTDAVGSAASNLSLSDRRAESMALALTEYFDIPPENLVVQGYGESELKVETLTDERANRRVVVRLVTPLMRTAELR